MRLYRFLALVLGSLLPVAAPAAESGSPPGSAQTDILEQLPPGMEANLIDPVTVPKKPLFENGEFLKYKLGWSFFTVARSTLSVEHERYGDYPALKITLKTRTNGFADALYKVRNLSISWVAPDMSRSFEYKAVQHEGGRDRDTQAIYDTVDLRARYVNHLKEENREPVDILPGTLDPLGIVFFARTLDFEVGDDLVIPTSNGKEFFYTIVHVVDKVERKFSIGRRSAYVLEPDIKDIGGVFKRSPDGSLRFYISADEQKLPLRMESEVAVGNFWAELVEVVDPDAVDEDDLIAVP